MTQKELANAMGISPTVVCRWEKDQVMPGIDNIKKLAKVLKRPPYGFGLELWNNWWDVKSGE